MRPKKTRWIDCSPEERCFRPHGRLRPRREGVVVTLDEIEAIRLADVEGMSQIQAAKKMKVHRSTVSRILESAHRKVGDALVNIKAIKVEGGCCKFRRRKL